jgi:DNA uptake protein ComE-like DNA-binding protein
VADTESVRTAGPQSASVAAYLAFYLLLGTIVALAWATRCDSGPLDVRITPPQVLADPQQQIASELPASATGVEFKVDPNTAGWAELAGLPGIGEVLAKRIVEYRQGQVTANGGRTVVFRRPEDLDAVRGIGPKTVEKLAKHLRFPEPASRPGL